MFEYTDGKLSIDFHAPAKAYKNFSFESAGKASISYTAAALSAAFLWARKVDQEKLHISNKAKSLDEQYKITTKATELEKKWAVADNVNKLKETVVSTTDRARQTAYVGAIVTPIATGVEMAASAATAVKEETLQKIAETDAAEAEAAEDSDNAEETPAPAEYSDAQSDADDADTED